MIILTLDTDWAPDWATALVLDKIKKLGLKTTIFFSTPSPVEPGPLVEMGAHPDLSQSRPDHRPEETILAEYAAWLPQARAFRSHRFHWHSDLSRALVKAGFTLDSSLIMPYHPHLQAFKVGKLTRFPVWASDHLHLSRGFPCDRLAMPNLDQPGLKIFCFHVAYLALNTPSLKDLNLITAALGPEPTSPPSDQPGIWTLFELLAERIYRKSKGLWLAEIPEDLMVKGAL